MRARDFLNEAAKGKMTKRQGMASVGVGTFRDSAYADRVYELNRIMMAAACADGVNPITSNPNAPDAESWSGRENTYHPYTSEENEMLKQAFELAGSVYTDIAKGDLKSQEVEGTNTKSTVVPFKGYKRK